MGRGSEHDVEQPLAGGRLTSGVVRVRDTVRRPASPQSRFVARLLTHLAKTGFDGCPQHLGWDRYGRDMLQFVPGHVPPRWQHFTDAQVRQAATLLRQLHDATRDLASVLRSEVVCHHDPGPNNTVFRDDQPVAFIDFDFAAPGHPLEDVGYMAWAWCISSRPDRGPATEQARQVRTLADAYGLSPTDRERLYQPPSASAYAATRPSGETSSTTTRRRAVALALPNCSPGPNANSPTPRPTCRRSPSH